MTAHEEYCRRKSWYDPAEDGPEVELINNFCLFPLGWQGFIFYLREEFKHGCDSSS